MNAPLALSATAQDYVKVVWNAGEWSDAPVTTKYLAERLGVSAPTVSENVRKLVTAGLLDHQPYGAIALTESGRLAALDMVRRHRLIETFLVTQLGYGWDEVHDEAEVLEHACSARFFDALDGLLGYPTRDPHGDPIPGPGGHLVPLDAVHLPAALPGRWTVARLSDANPGVLRDLATLGLVVDAPITVLGPDGTGGIAIEASGAGVSPGAGTGIDSTQASTVTLPELTAQAVWLVTQGQP